MSDDDTKVTDLKEHRKKKFPVAPAALRDAHAIVTELIETLEAQGSSYLIGSYMGGWSFSIKREKIEAPHE